MGSDDPRALLERYARSQGPEVSAYDIASQFSAPGDITFGTEAAFGPGIGISVAALDATHFVAAYRDWGNSNHGTAIVGQVNGTSITYGTEIVFNAALTEQLSVAALDATHFVVAYRDGGNSRHGTAIVGTVSGTSITYGAEYVFNTLATDINSVAALDATHFVVGYVDGGNSFHGTAIVGQVSGTRITYGAEKVFNAAESLIISVAALDATHFVVGYEDRDNSQHGTARVGRVSGTRITYGAESVFNAGSTNSISVAAFDATHFVVEYENWGNSAGDATARVGTVNGTSITYDAKTVFNPGRTYELSAAVLDGTHFVNVYRYGNLGPGRAIVGQVGPDLSVVQSNSGTPVAVGQQWQWRLQVSNTGTAPATFAAGDVLLSDALPQTGVNLNSVTVDNQTGITGTIKCAVNNVLTCWASGGPVTLAKATGSFRVVVTARGTATGSYTNPTGGTCAVDPNNAVPEGDETNNACIPNTVEVSLPDLSVVQSNSTGGTPVAVGQPWQWRLQVANTGSIPATFAKDDVLLVDYLPTPGVTYDATVTVDNQTGITGTISCAIDGVQLRCTASGGPVTIGATTGSFRAVVTATATAAGSYTNPTTGGTCAVDPGGNVSETDETNNACNEDTVVAIEVPDLSVVKSNTGSPVTVGQSWQWHLQVSNTGTGDATFASGTKLLIDHLPTTGVSYDATVTVDNQTGITGTISCAINAGVLRCTASGGAVTVAQATGSFRAVVTATASVAGSYTNPTGGTCAVDPGEVVSESDETNNACNADTVVVQGVPELSVVTSNNGTPVAVGQSWKWYLQVSNTGTAAAPFASGETLLVDHLPTTAVSYNPTVILDNFTGISALDQIICSITAGVLTCTADGSDGVTLAAATGTFRAVVTATASATGSYTNPTGGTCSVDPGEVVSESDETNNACNIDTVDVRNPGVDLGVTITESADPVQAGSGAGNLIYTVTVANSGSLDASGVALSNILTLPSGVTLDSVTPSVGTFAAPTWTLGDLASGASATLTVTLTVGASAASGTDVVDNTATVTAVDQPDTDTSNDSASEATSVTAAPMVDLAVSVAESTDPVVAGSGADNLIYTITVTNNGPAAASGVALSNALTLPSGVTLDSVTPSVGTFAAPTWDLGSLASGASATLTVTLTVAATAAAGTDVIDNTVTVTAVDQPDSDASNDSASEATSIVELPPAPMVDLQVTVAESADPVTAGSGVSNLVYTATVINNGPDGATGVALSNTLTLPSGVTLDSVTPSSGTFAAPTWTLGGLASGSSATLTVTLTVAATVAAGTDVIANATSVTAVDQPDSDASNDSASEATSIVELPPAPMVDLQVSVAESADPVVAGSGTGNLTYTATVTNNGPAAASGVELENALTLPSGVTLESVTPSVGTFADPTWTLGDLASGSSATLTVTLTVDASAAAGTDVIANATSITAVDQPDSDASNDSASEATSVVEPPPAPMVDLQVTVAESADPVTAGSGVSNLVYTATVTNNGPDGATGVALSNTLTLPSGVTLDSVTPSVGTFADPMWNLGALASGASATLTVTLTVAATAAAGTDVIANATSITAVDQPDSDASNDSASEATSVVESSPAPMVDLQVTLAESTDPVTAGSGVSNLVYTATVTNNGPDGATGVALSSALTLPSGVTLDSVTPSSGTFAAPTWNLGSLASGSSATLTITLTVDASAAAGINVIADAVTVTAVDQPDTDASNDSASEATSVVAPVPDPPEVDLQVTLAESADPVTAGSGAGNLTYTATVTNDGDDATGLAFDGVLTLPPGVRIETITPSTGTFSGATWTLGDLASGQSATITFVLTVEAAATPGRNVIGARAQVSALDQANRGEDTAARATSIRRQADLSLTKEDAGLIAEPGAIISYTLAYHNDGPSNAQATLIETVPVGTTFDAAASTGAWSCADGSPAGTICRHALGSLTPGDAGSQTFAVRVDNPRSAGLSAVANTASITAADDPEEANNTATATTPVEASVTFYAALTDTLVVDQDSDGRGDAGDIIEYTATVSNTGNQHAIDVVYQQTLDAHTALDCTSLSVSEGSITACTDGAGGSFSVKLTSGSAGSARFGGQSAASLSFEAQVLGSLRETQEVVSTQGRLQYTDDTTTETLMTDDPSTAAQDDPTATVVDPSSEVATSVEAADGVPVSFALEGNYPNPFNPQTTIPFVLPVSSEVRLVVYDVTGRQVAELVSGHMASGRHEVVWQAGDLPSGVYLVRMQAGSFNQVRRMTLVK